MERLQKIIANRGYASRRKAEELILAGKVKVDGEIVRELGLKFNERVSIEIDGNLLQNEEKVYFLLNKPRGVLSTASDDKNRKTVVDLIPTNIRIYPVGRLDYDTTGLLLLTNDGELTNLLTHPRNNIDKVYIAKVEGMLKKEEINTLKNGVEIDGFKTSPARVKVKKYDYKTNMSIVEIVIHEGKNHQVKKMFDKINHPVVKLKRERYAFLDLTGVKSGDYRILKVNEVKKLYSLAKQNKM